MSFPGFGGLSNPSAQGFFGSAMGGSPSSFTSPPIDPKILAALAALAGQNGQPGGMPGGAPGSGGLPPNSVAPGAPHLQPPPGGSAPMGTGGGIGGGMGGGLGGMNPEMLRMLLQRMGIGGPMPAAGMGGAQ